MRTTNVNAKSAIVFVVLSVLFYAFTLNEDIRLRKIKQALHIFYTDYHQQKAYLHTDRTEYNAGEDIWFKAYLVNAGKSKHDSISTNFYVEMVNPRNQIIFTKRLRLKNGMAAGDFYVYDTLAQGTYTIRAYTNWMQNFNPGYIYTKEIRINNPGHQIIKNHWIQYKKIDRKVKRNEKKIDVQFFPEGGNLVHGIKARVAFKAINANGKGIEIKGAVLNSAKNEVVSFESEHNGMGDFFITPDMSEKYTVKVMYGDGKEKKVDLPEIEKTGVVMNILEGGSQLLGKVYTNRFIANDRYANEVIVVAHQNGNVFFDAIYLLSKDSLQFTIPLSGAPAGVLHITLFNGRGYPVCERLYYHKIPISTKTRIIAGKNKYRPKEKVKLNFEVLKKNKPQSGSASVSVVSTEYAKANDVNIWNYLTLVSDLSGKVANPGFYLQDTPESDRALDLLLLTQGWKRFVWKDIIDGNFPIIRNPVEDGIMIEGKITRDFFGIPLKDATVTLSVMDEYNDFYQQTTPKDGSFSFKNLNYSDTVSLKIEARHENGRKNLLILLNEGDRPEKEEVNQGVYYSKEQVKRPYYKYYEPKEDKEEEGGLEQPEIFRIYGEPDVTVNMEDLPQGSSNLLDALKGRVPGLMITGNKAIIRGVNTFYGSTDPLLVVDGVPTDFDYIHSISPNDVDKIEILKGPSTAMYGSRGANGVIAIYTKRGKFMIRGELDVEILGYYIARQFYSPKYEDKSAPEYKLADNRKTIFWNPNITLDEKGKASVSFYNADDASFTITLEGLTNNGDILYEELLVGD